MKFYLRYKLSNILADLTKEVFEVRNCFYLENKTGIVTTEDFILSIDFETAFINIANFKSKREYISTLKSTLFFFDSNVEKWKIRASRSHKFKSFDEMLEKSRAMQLIISQLER